MTEYEHHLLKASLEVAVERALSMAKLARNRVMARAVQKRLNEALKELLLVSPDFEKVEAAIRYAETYGFSGDDLERTRHRMRMARKPTGWVKSAKKAKKKSSKKRSSTKKSSAKKRLSARARLGASSRSHGRSIGRGKASKKR